jgi:hypothetical protein
MYTEYLWGNLGERHNLEDTGVDGRIILKWIFRNWGGRSGLDCSGSEWEGVVGSCECGNEPSGFKKCGKFLD